MKKLPKIQNKIRKIMIMLTEKQKKKTTKKLKKKKNLTAFIKAKDPVEKSHNIL